MREIKFRAWHVPEKQFIWDFMLSSNGQEIREIRWPLTKMREGMSVADYDRDKFILEQFTGLKDKDGVEIYEGDIVQCYSHPSCEKVERRIVDFYEFREMIWSRVYDGLTRVEVIGNIHENPDLLK